VSRLEPLCGTAAQFTEGGHLVEIGARRKLSVQAPTVLDMDTTRRLRAVEAPEPAEPGSAPRTQDAGAEEYWARVQELRADLARLRPAN
jgi:hypothetical protein